VPLQGDAKAFTLDSVGGRKTLADYGLESPGGPRAYRLRIKVHGNSNPVYMGANGTAGYDVAADTPEDFWIVDVARFAIDSKGQASVTCTYHYEGEAPQDKDILKPTPPKPAAPDGPS
jgi:hypothetical protein